ncbi:MAG: CHASE2 domain-containing protein [Proteobacteria bacterium]|nr:CHASE2 domain-containing protein [Pseudomonadota bacterium]
MPRLTLDFHSISLKSGRFLIAACGIALTIGFCGLSLYLPAFLPQLDGRFFDGLISNDSVSQEESGPVVIALDDESLARYGRWPWPRARMARLLARIAEQGPASVGIDIIFAEAESPGGRDQVVGAVHQLSAGDLALAKALAAGPFVPGFELTFAPASFAGGAPLLHPLNVVFEKDKGAADPRKFLWRATGAVNSLPEFSRSVVSAGFLNAAMEHDGILRRMPLLIEYGGKIYPSLGLATVLRAAGVSGAVLESNRSGNLYLKTGTRRIPLDDHGRLLLRYRGWHGAITTFSAAAVLEGRVPRKKLAGRVVLLGATAVGIGDSVATPVDQRLPGVQAHAIAADNILRGDFARLAAGGYRLLAVLVLGGVSLLVCIGLPVIRGAMLLALAAIGAWLGATWLFHSSGVFLSPVLPLLALTSNFSLLTLVRLFFVEKRVQNQKRDLAATRDFIMTSLASLAQIRDTETGTHIMRTQRYLHILCTEVSRHPRFRHLLNKERIELVSKLAVLHDIGKVGIADNLLRKPTRFTVEEYENVKKHAAYGRDAIIMAESRTGDYSDELLRYAKDIAYSHHERWDGTGYPEGLRGEQIPWVGRLMAVADVYDALVTKRVYKGSVPHEEAVRIIAKGRGVQFDPDVVDAFLRVEGQWRRIASELKDPVDAASPPVHEQTPL